MTLTATRTPAHPPLRPAAPVGVLLREWRAARRVSQLHLALEAGRRAGT